MTKIMLVEDDKSLREIYGVRLLAEGYDIVSAGDGEEALAMAIKERPNLIVSDVMMPKISGFDMLDILRSTTETKNIKVIMMTALSSEEQRTRGESLGADRYLVKSQVGIEDVVRVVHEVLEDSVSTGPIAASPTTSTPDVTSAPREAAPTSAVPARPAYGTPAAPQQPYQAPQAVPASQPQPQPQAYPAPAAAPEPVQPSPIPQPAMAPHIEAPKPASIKSRVIEPLNDPSVNDIDINRLLDNEMAREAGADPGAFPTMQTTAEEKQTLEQELANFQQQGTATNDNSFSPPPPPPPPPSTSTPPQQQ